MTPVTDIVGMDELLQRIDHVVGRLDRIETALTHLVHERTAKEWYSTAEVAELLDKAEFTVREWCRLGRVNAEKRRCGRGRSREWMLCHEELLRVQNEGLLPAPRF